jgi:hypothetical protein
MAQMGVVELLPSKCEALTSTSVPQKKKAQVRLCVYLSGRGAWDLGLIPSTKTEQVIF